MCVVLQMGIYEFVNQEFVRITNVLTGFRVRAQFRQFTDYWYSGDLSTPSRAEPTLYANTHIGVFALLYNSPVDGAVKNMGYWMVHISKDHFEFLDYYISKYAVHSMKNLLTN